MSFEKESRIEAAHQSERLRAAVLDSLAHAVKTPLTAIQTANAGLREVGKLNASQNELVSLVQEESSQLGQLCTRLLQTAKLEAEELSLGKEEIVIGELVSRALQKQTGHLAGHAVEVAVPDPDITVRGDSELLLMALTQFLDNAVNIPLGEPRSRLRRGRATQKSFYLFITSDPQFQYPTGRRSFSGSIAARDQVTLLRVPESVYLR